MPKKKKTGPGAVAGQSGEHVSAHYYYNPGPNGSASVTRDLSGSTMSDLSLQNKDEIVKSMHDMFSDLDPDVIFIVLSEADFKVENAMDALLELSGAAEGKTTTSPPLSGFETAAALLEPRPSHTKSSTERPVLSGASNYEESHQELSPETTRLTEEFDSLIDQELESLTMRQPLPSSITPSVLPLPSESAPLSAGAPPSPLLAQEALTELDQLDVTPNDTKLGSLSEQSSFSTAKIGGGQRNASPINELSLGGVSFPQESGISLDFSHLTRDSTFAAPRPSAFKAYRRPDQYPTQMSVNIPRPQSVHTFWNIQAPDFKPCMDGPAFITPVVPNPWTTNPISVTQWMPSRPVSHAPLKPSATVPKSWMLYPQSRLKLEGQVLVLLRGAPGSGKTTLASEMLEQNPGGIVLSTDEYFTQNGVYHFEPHLLGEAHAWNHQRAKEAFEERLTPIIIDNTNLQCWEMKPYVALAQKHKYRVLFREPNTWWKTKARELEKRTKHGVTKEKIRRMLENQDRHVSVQNIMASQPKSTAIYGVDVCDTHPTEQPLASHPDLVGDSRFGKPGSYLSSSLPDVSSVDCKCSSTSANMGAAETNFGSHGSKEYVSSRENVTELLDGADIDRELDACMEISGQNDCNINEDLGLLEARTLEQPVMYAESISQRVKRARAQTRTADGDASTLKCDFSDSVRKASQGDSVDDYTGDGVSLNTEQLEFVGDWPCESLEQRGQRSRKSASQTGKSPNEEMSNFEEDTTKYESKFVGHLNSDTPDKTEFQKLLDLLQGDNNQITQETSQDFLPVGGDGYHSCLGTKAQSVLPDCVLDWKSERSSDPGKGNSHTPSPIKELGASQDESSQRDTKEACTDVHTPSPIKELGAGQDESSKRDTKEAGTDVHTPSPIKELGATQNESSKRDTKEACTDEHAPANGVMGLKRGSEQKTKPNHNAYLPLSSGGEVEFSSESSQERRKVPSRRAGKSCKLALTFTHQSPSSCPHAGYPVTSLQQSELNPSPEPPEPPELLFPTCHSAFAQTEPQDFALLWRIDQQKCPEPESDTSGIVILEGNPLRYVPKINKEKSSEQQVIPYRVCHEKGSQVEENDLRELPFKQNSLEILSRHFKHVPKETLEDLYEKCHQDMEWTTNLLLDSGEHLCRDDEENVFDHEDTEGYDLVQGAKKEFVDCQVIGELFEPKIICTRDTVIQETGSNCCENPPILVPNNTSLTMGIVEREPEDSNDQSIKLLEHQPEEPDQRETLDCVTGPSPVMNPNEPVGENKALKNSLQPELKSEIPQTEVSEKCLGGGLMDEVEEDRETKEEVNAITRAWLEEMVHKQEEQRKEREKERRGQRKNGPMNIQTLEMKLTTELALQLTELFGPVGISPGEFSPENCSVVMDLNLAKLLHQKWKETIQEKHRQAALSYHLLQESSVHWGDSQPTAAGLGDSATHFLIGADGYSSLVNQSGVQEGFPLMDHWNMSRPPVSLRDIMLEQQVLQDSLEKSRLSRWDLDKKDGAAVVKEKQLFDLFPTIDRHFLRDIFRDHNYSLEQTEQFLHTLLDDEPVRTVVASESVPENNEKCRAPSKERLQKNDTVAAQFQDIEDPEYVDFRTEATLQRQRQQECFDKAAEAYRQGRKDVASFYAQQGHLHGQKMKEANHRAAVQIFERVNSTLLPQNVLDLHGLHVNEALHHLQQVLATKTLEWQQGKCRPQLSVITGRGNHSQGGVARVRPAVLDYLKSQHYKFTEPKPGLVIVVLHGADY
ncbi:NEDD4-binding protein 2 [Ictalurus punctatus]|uniref:NEDD4-binding protein 2 n=1 Tax=Ictalurus punctatus TaxID=7998 RepID=A0A2D0QED6_ICTPU|nr:NEDD4-binding protein 2 [Ictalurus punctatus]